MKPRSTLCLVFGVWLSLSALACGGDKGSNPGGGSGTSQTDAERAATVEAVRRMVETTIPDGLHPPDGANAAITTALRAMPEFSEARELPGGAWARFQDGEELFVFNNRFENEMPTESEGPDSAAYIGDPPAGGGALDLDTMTARQPVLAPMATVPTSKKARLIQTMGTAFMNSVPVLRPWLENAGYDVTAPADGSVEALRGVVGDGVVYFSGHGLPDSSASGHMALWTTTKETEANNTRYRSELGKDSGRLAHGIGAVDRNPPPIPGGFGTTVWESHIVITEKFVRDFWRPAPGALLYMDACYSLDPRLMNVLLSAPVNFDAVVAWSDITYDDMATPSARFFFDRVLGANAYAPFRSPKQRPFDAASVVAAMGVVKRKNGFPFDLSIRRIGPLSLPPEARLRLRTRGSESTSILKPGIAFARIAEISDPGWLEINGSFGTQQGTVLFNNQPLTVQSGGWTSSRIRCNRPPDNSGFTGDIVVEVNGHRSNPRRMTGWNLDCDIHWQEFGPLCPACQWDATWRGKLRIDADLVRSGPEMRARHGVQTSSATTAQQLTLDAASGSYRITLDTQYDVSWSIGTLGSPPVIGVCLGYLPLPKYVGFCFQFDSAARQMTLQPTFETTAINAFHVPVSGMGNQAGSQPAYASFPGNFPGRGGTATLDSGFHIIEGQQPSGTGQTLLHWSGAAPIDPPNAGSAK